MCGLDLQRGRIGTRAKPLAPFLKRLGATADLDAARSPGLDAGKIVYDECHARIVLRIPELLALRKTVPADVDGVGLRIVTCYLTGSVEYYIIQYSY